MQYFSHHINGVRATDGDNALHSYCHGRAAQSPVKRNILFIMADQLSAPFLTLHAKNAPIRTVNCNSPFCAPSRICVCIGQLRSTSDSHLAYSDFMTVLDLVAQIQPTVPDQRTLSTAPIPTTRLDHHAPQALTPTSCSSLSSYLNIPPSLMTRRCGAHALSHRSRQSGSAACLVCLGHRPGHEPADAVAVRRQEKSPQCRERIRVRDLGQIRLLQHRQAAFLHDMAKLAFVADALGRGFYEEKSVLSLYAMVSRCSCRLRR